MHWVIYFYMKLLAVDSIQYKFHYLKITFKYQSEDT